MITIGEIAAALLLWCAWMICHVGWCKLFGVFLKIWAPYKSRWKPSAKPHALIDNDNAKTLTVKNGEITFDDVTFNYGKAVALLITSPSLLTRWEGGSCGPSGAGKSTIVSLFTSPLWFGGGKILIDGQDIAHVTQDSLRAQIGWWHKIMHCYIALSVIILLMAALKQRKRKLNCCAPSKSAWFHCEPCR